mgnify:CR=1 FL=1
MLVVERGNALSTYEIATNTLSEPKSRVRSQSMARVLENGTTPETPVSTRLALRAPRQDDIVSNPRGDQTYASKDRVACCVPVLHPTPRSPLVMPAKNIELVLEINPEYALQTNPEHDLENTFASIDKPSSSSTVRSRLLVTSHPPFDECSCVAHALTGTGFMGACPACGASSQERDEASCR